VALDVREQGSMQATMAESRRNQAPEIHSIPKRRDIPTSLLISQAEAELVPSTVAGFQVVNASTIALVFHGTGSFTGCSHDE
jgi:hypothetical protein